jgi:hypothetical protein
MGAHVNFAARSYLALGGDRYCGSQGDFAHERVGHLAGTAAVYHAL